MTAKSILSQLAQTATKAKQFALLLRVLAKDRLPKPLLLQFA